MNTCRLALWLSIFTVSVVCQAGGPGHPPFPPPPAEPAPLPNELFIKNDAGAAASFSTEGFVDRADAFHTPQGTNGRSCATCHNSEAGWSVTPAQIQKLFITTRGTHPIFNRQDANSPNADLATLPKRKAAYSMLLRGLFRRGGPVPANAEFKVVAVDDPNGVGSTETFSFYRRPLTTANLPIMVGVLWDDRLTVAGEGSPPRGGLIRQARGNITGAQEGPPPSDALVSQIVDEELMIWHAQIAVPGVGRLDTCGGRGGPALLSNQPRVAGRFDLYDAWLGLVRCDTRFGDARRAQIARGQELFNERRNGNTPAGTCRGCHNVANNGTNAGGGLMDIGISSAARRTPGLPLYTLEHKVRGDRVQTTDPGKASHSGRWADINLFKVPTLRGVAARPPYFHNGSAATLRDVVRHYEQSLNFRFTQDEEDDLIAFLNAL